jgi:AraC-like DNA-binding protein
MTYRECLPSPPLRGLVAAYWGIDDDAAAPALRRILPDGCADLICDFSGVAPRMRWVGTMTHAIEVAGGARQRLFGIRFAPGGLYPLLGAPLSLFTDGSAGVDELPARVWRPPLQAWCEDGGFAARCHRADASLLAILPQLPGTATTPLRRWLQGAPAVPPSASALADELGLGMRTLQRRFMDHLGVSPRQHLRWLRFERARQLLVNGGGRAVEVALAAGYSDQAHFVREFRRFAGVTPGRYR